MRSREATEKKIIAAATALFAKHGLNGVSVRTIATSAQVNLSLISQYFGGKHALYLRCLNQLFTAFESALNQLVGDSEKVGGPTELVRFAILTAVELGKTRRAAVLLTMRHFVENGALDEARRDALLVPALDFFTVKFTPFSELREDDLRMSLFSAILVVGRLIAFNRYDLTAVRGTPSVESDFTDFACDMVSRMIGLSRSTTPHGRCGE